MHADCLKTRPDRSIIGNKLLHSFQFASAINFVKFYVLMYLHSIQIRGNLSTLLNVPEDDDNRTYHPDLSKEINQWRKK